MSLSAFSLLVNFLTGRYFVISFVILFSFLTFAILALVFNCFLGIVGRSPKSIVPAPSALVLDTGYLVVTGVAVKALNLTSGGLFSSQPLSNRFCGVLSANAHFLSNKGRCGRNSNRLIHPYNFVLCFIHKLTSTNMIANLFTSVNAHL